MKEFKLREILKYHCQESMVVITSNELETVIKAMKEACDLCSDNSPTFYDRRTPIKNDQTKIE